MKMNQEEESHNAPLTEKPLRAGEKAEDETNTKEGQGQGETNVKLGK